MKRYLYNPSQSLLHGNQGRSGIFSKRPAVKLLVAFSLLAIHFENVSAQDVSLRLSAQEGGTDDNEWLWQDYAPRQHYAVVAEVCNNDAARTVVPAQKLLVTVTLPSPATVKFSEQPYQTLVPAGWKIMKWSDLQLAVTNEGDAIPAGTCRSIPLYTHVYNVGNDKVLEGKLEFVGDALPGNREDNDVARQVIQVDKGLPVSLISFDATREKQTGVLSWATAMEANSDFFEIQRSIDGKKWSAIGNVAAHGESQSDKYYSYQDPSPYGGINFYRLRMVDRDNFVAFSRMVSLDFTNIRAAVYPNPVTGSFSISGNVGKDAYITIRTLSGQLVMKQKWTSDKINISQLVPGLYLVDLHEQQGKVTSQKIMVGNQR